ncbi:MAG TPA: cysteine hydrolase family protein [Actinospica sp.]|nr:cysteine hydrolase family protein [Actinospica sp.]
MADALIVVDVQAAFVLGPAAVADAEPVLENIRLLLNRARATGALVVHLQNDGADGSPDEPGTPGWELALPVELGETELVVRKTKDDGFVGTGLNELLHRYDVDRLIVCGVQSEMCVGATARGALERGYRVILPHDAHSTYDIPAVEGLAERVPARHVARVAEWALGDEVEIPVRARDVDFIEVARR